MSSATDNGMVRLAPLPPVEAPICVTLTCEAEDACRRGTTARSLVGGRKLSTVADGGLRIATFERQGRRPKQGMRHRASCLSRLARAKCLVSVSKRSTPYALASCQKPTASPICLQDCPKLESTCVLLRLEVARTYTHTKNSSACHPRLDPRKAVVPSGPGCFHYSTRASASINDQKQARFSPAVAKR